MDPNMSSFIGADSKDYVTSLARGLAVIRCFDKDHCRLTLTEVASRTELARATARRFLHTLHALGYVESDGKYFWLSARVLNLGFSYLNSQPLVELIQPYIKEVSEHTGESCSVSVLDLPDVVYIARSLTRQLMSVSLNIGSRLPALSTSMGRVLLAAMPEQEIYKFIKKKKINKFTKHTLTDDSSILNEVLAARSQGYSLVNEELEIGLSSVSVPIINKQGKAVAAINISSQPQKMDKKRLKEELLPSLQQAAAKIAEVLPVDESLSL
ncbi:MAG: IclR family transcriptional regulator [Gammaproteobacteria bacterium]|nr:IclR family transcriptional regulator [Gammaproteobacteria bacterium]